MMLLQSVFLILHGCAPLKASQPSQSPENVRPSLDFPNYNTEAASALGWTNLTIQANGATSKLDSSGHYSTDKNMCQLKGDGVLELKTWNLIAPFFNEATQKPLATSLCVVSDSESRFYNPGKAILNLENKKSIPLLELKENQICFGIEIPPEKQKILISLIEDIIQIADRADAHTCPNYRP